MHVAQRLNRQLLDSRLRIHLQTAYLCRCISFSHNLEVKHLKSLAGIRNESFRAHRAQRSIDPCNQFRRYLSSDVELDAPVGKLDINNTIESINNHLSKTIYAPLLF